MSRILFAFQVLGLLTSWFQAATADGRVTSEECAQLVVQLGEMMGFKLAWDVTVDERKEPELRRA